MIIEKILDDGFYIIKEHVNHVHTDEFQLIQITDQEEVHYTGTFNDCETHYYEHFPLSDGMS